MSSRAIPASAMRRIHISRTMSAYPYRRRSSVPRSGSGIRPIWW
ncbi:hypothetical protein BC477_07775 [Clavibacter michiganensis subsp. michiganensis]|uniref:Uncharacterized protein n=1 Tax=Clavibacter michiganensis subsp. michiganensis TaxID=33013 RepID=A0A251XNJ5_CLAMM|nr:hypothetical protein BC477_07775 [Clavibacter michiganensis subsp. michiganensis]OUE04618.1 hypothetical protein CMMCAS07_06705 [Clavibacter michiganensis subsp. michiganensis]